MPSVGSVNGPWRERRDRKKCRERSFTIHERPARARQQPKRFMSKYVSDDHVRRLLIVETIIQDRPRELRFPLAALEADGRDRGTANRSGNDSPSPLNRGVTGWSGSFTA